MNSRQRSDDTRYGYSKYGEGKKSRFDSPKPSRFGINPPDFQAPSNTHFLNDVQRPQGNVNLWSENEDFYGEHSSNEPLVFNGPQMEDEPFVSDEFVTLDWYNSDLNLEIDRNHFCGGSPISRQGFGYMWAGVRANHGVVRGKVCFEVQISSKNNVEHLNDPHSHALRVGWSIDESGLMLGEEGFSYGYDSSGKAFLSNKFEGYGQSFGLGDIIGCYLDLSSDPVNIGFTLNGEFQGIAFSVGQAQLSGRALFPHICTRNQEFSINFGQLSQPLMPIIPGYIHLGQLEMNDGLFPGNKGPKARQECEVLLLIGLPGAGKSFFAEDHKIKYPEKRYNIIGISSILEKMSINGEKLTRGMEGDAVLQAAVDVLGVLTHMAAKRRRNYILDQANVSPKVRQRKMMTFNGFQRKAIVLVPTEDVYLQRIAKCEAREGKELPKHVILNMKANFILPEAIETYFRSILYTELGPIEASRLVEGYNNEAWRAGFIMNSGVEQFVQDSMKYRQMNRISGPIGSILNESMLCSENVLNSSNANNNPGGFNDEGKRNSNSSPYSAGGNRGGGGSYYSSKNFTPRGKGIKTNNHVQRYSPASSSVEEPPADVEIVKEMHFPGQAFGDDRRQQQQPNNRQRSRSRSLEGNSRAPPPFQRRNNEDSTREKPSSYQGGYSRRGDNHTFNNDGSRFDGGFNEGGQFNSDNFKGESRFNNPGRKFAPFDGGEDEQQQFYSRRGEDYGRGFDFPVYGSSTQVSSNGQPNANYINRKPDKRQPFPVPTMVSYPKNNNNVPPAPHIRPLSEVKVSTPSYDDDGGSSYKSCPSMMQDFNQRQGGPPTPVPPVASNRFSGSRMPNRNYPNVSYPKY